jgi:hypothetical protein
MPWLALVALVVLLQVALAAYVFYDAHRRQLANAIQYVYGVTVPLVGFVVFRAYLDRRDEEQTRDPGEVRVEQPDTGLAWRVRVPDPVGLPLRFGYAMVGLWRRFWLIAVVGVPTVLFAAALTIDPRINAGALSVCGVLWVIVWGLANSYRDGTVRIDREDGTLVSEYVSGFIWRGSKTEETVNLADIARVRAIPCGRRSVLRLAYHDPRTTMGPAALVVDRSREQAVLDTIESAGGETRQAGYWRAGARVAGTLVSIGVLPVVVTVATGELGGDLLLFFLLGLVAWLLVQIKRALDSAFASGPS